MRCKNCKKQIENENYFRCPHCGKPIQKKKEIDKKELLSVVPFTVISGIYIVLTFCALFFTGNIYNKATLVISLVVYLVMFPFLFGNYKGMKRSVADTLAIITTLPFIASWGVSFLDSTNPLMVDNFSAVYLFSIIGVILIVDIILMLKATEVIKSGRIVKWICVGLAVAIAAFTVTFYAIDGRAKLLAILVVAANAFIPPYMAYHVISRDSRAED